MLYLLKPSKTITCKILAFIYDQIHEKIHFGSSNLMIREDLMNKVVLVNQLNITYQLIMSKLNISNNLQISHYNMHKY